MEYSSQESNAAKESILLTEKYYFHICWIAKYILFYKPEPTVYWLWSVLDDLSTFEYIEIMMKFWSMNMICGVWMNGVTVCYGWEFWKLWLQWNMNVILKWVYSLGTWCLWNWCMNKGVWIDLKGMNVCCDWDLNYANIDWWIDVLNCLWNLIESMC